MIFNSVDFAIFLPIVFLLYWFVFNKNLKLQNFFILVVSYIFYGWWDWRFLFLILFSTVLDFLIGLKLSKTENSLNRKLFLALSVCVNLGFLGFFKYYNFFVDNFIQVFTFFGQPFSARTLDIILPVGISFYTFQTLSYTIDVYKRKLTPTDNLISFAAFVSFFPQLVAGPIERATDLLPQFYKKRKFEYYEAVEGLRQMLWGLFKKVVVADNCAYVANQIFDKYEDYNASTLAIGAVLFAFQIYGDFSGYSDIAIGTSKLFGFNLKQNFAFPYFSRSVAEFWRRWHISLNTWFRDYLYIPLGGSKKVNNSMWRPIRNTFIIFLVSGFWHGANWTFIFWGALSAVYFLPLMLTNKNRKHLNVVADGKILPSLTEVFEITLTFILTTFAWIFFRADNITTAFAYIEKMFSLNIFSFTNYERPNYIVIIFLLIAFQSLFEWLSRDKTFGLAFINKIDNRFYRFAIYILLAMMIILFKGEKQEFIY